MKQKKLTPIMETIQKLRSREISARELPNDLLLDIVLTLRLHGQSTVAIADLLGYSHRQVQRFTSEVWKNNRHEFTIDFWGSHIGKYNLRMEVILEFLTRTYNDPSCSAQERIVAAMNAAKIHTVWTNTLQSLGCLPVRGLEVKSQLYPELKDAEEDIIDHSSEDLVRPKLEVLTPLERYSFKLKLDRLKRDLDEKSTKLLEEALHEKRRLKESQELNSDTNAGSGASSEAISWEI